jgi:hypothetical protein
MNWIAARRVGLTLFTFYWIISSLITYINIKSPKCGKEGPVLVMSILFNESAWLAFLILLVWLPSACVDDQEILRKVQLGIEILYILARCVLSAITGYLLFMDSTFKSARKCLPLIVHLQLFLLTTGIAIALLIFAGGLLVCFTKEIQPAIITPIPLMIQRPSPLIEERVLSRSPEHIAVPTRSPMGIAVTPRGPVLPLTPQYR